MRRSRTASRSIGWLGVLWISPTVLLFAAVIGWPLVSSILISFSEVNSLTLASRPVGAANYREMLADSAFWSALRTNLVWVFSCVAIEVTAGVFLALLLHQQFLGRSIARTLVLFPYVLPTVVAVLIWQWMLNDIYGIVNSALVALGVNPIDWFGMMPNALISVIVIGSWRVLPFVVVAILARLQSIPEQLYEAARIDGASNWALFWDITLPQLRGVLFGVILLRMIWDFKEFDLIYLLTGGGPVSGTTVLSLLIYNEAFALLRMGKASAIAVTMLFIIGAMILIYFRLFADDENLER